MHWRVGLRERTTLLSLRPTTSEIFFPELPRTILYLRGKADWRILVNAATPYGRLGARSPWLKLARERARPSACRVPTLRESLVLRCVSGASTTIRLSGPTIRLPLGFRKRKHCSQREWTNLRKVSLAEHMMKRPSELSPPGGRSHQPVAIALRVARCAPRCILFDESRSSAMDPKVLVQGSCLRRHQGAAPSSGRWSMMNL
jgi:hypothetical protein